MLRWFGHVKRRPQRAPVLEKQALLVVGIRRKGRPKLRQVREEQTTQCGESRNKRNERTGFGSSVTAQPWENWRCGFVNDKVAAVGYRQQMVKRMASMNTRLNIKKLNENIVQNHRGSKQVGFKQLGPGVETGVHEVHDEKHVWFKVELQGALRDRKAERSIQQCMKSGVAKHLGVAGIQQKNGLVNKTNVTLFAKCIFLEYRKGIVGNKLWRLDDVTSKVVLYRNMGFNKTGEYKKTFIGSGVGTGSVQVLQEVEFEVEPQEDHTFEVEPHGNVVHVVGSQVVQTQDLIYYHSTCDKEQHSAWELFSYREDSNEAAFAVAVVDKIYAHELLNFNNTVACEVIFKWEAGLKDDMVARLDVYVLSNSCKKCSDDSDGYYWEYTPGMFIHLYFYIDDMVFSCGCKAEIWVTKGLLVKAKGNILGLEIIRDQSGNTLRVSHSRIYNEKLVQTLLKVHSTLSLEDSYQ
nr:zinc finger, CCHC-type [Tanacetum cinerariifolium]